MFDKTSLQKQKEKTIIELAKLESSNWASDDDVAKRVCPYVLIDAINILLNSEIVDRPSDYDKSGKAAQSMLDSVLSKGLNDAIERAIEDINSEMPVQAPDDVKKDIDECYRDSIKRHILPLIVGDIN